MSAMRAATILLCLLAGAAQVASGANTNGAERAKCDIALLKAVYKTEHVHTHQGGYLVNANDGAQVIIRPTRDTDRWSVSEIRSNPDIGMLFDAERAAKAWRAKQRLKNR
jgi:hypothetical protein